MNILVLKTEPNPSLNDGWISGFIDSEGCFTVSVLNNKQVQVRCIISQKGEKRLMDLLSIILNGKVHYLASYKGYNMVINLTKLTVVLNYLAKYPLKTKKHISFLNWVKVYKLVINKEHFSEEGINKIMQQFHCSWAASQHAAVSLQLSCFAA